MTVMIMPPYAIRLSTRCRFSISFKTEFDRPTVFRTSRAFLCALCSQVQGDIVTTTSRQAGRHILLPCQQRPARFISSGAVQVELFRLPSNDPFGQSTCAGWPLLSQRLRQAFERSYGLIALPGLRRQIFEGHVMTHHSATVISNSLILQRNYPAGVTTAHALFA